MSIPCKKQAPAWKINFPAGAFSFYEYFLWNTKNGNAHLCAGCLALLDLRSALLQKISLRTQRRPRRPCYARDGFSRFSGDHTLRHSKARRYASARFMPASKVVFCYFSLRLASGSRPRVDSRPAVNARDANIPFKKQAPARKMNLHASSFLIRYRP